MASLRRGAGRRARAQCRIILQPPAPPSMPAGAVMSLQIDKGRTVVGGQTTQWIDQAGGLVFADTGIGPTVTAEGVQQYDAQLFGTGVGMERAASLWSNNQARTLIMVLRNPTPGNAAGTVGQPLSGVFRYRSTSPYWALFVGQSGNNFIVGESGSTGSSLKAFIGGSPGTSLLGLSVATWRSTPNSGGKMLFRLNGLNYPTTDDLGPDTGTPDIQVGYNSAGGATGVFPGDIEEVYAFDGQLTDAQVQAWENYATGKFIIPGMPGYENDTLGYQKPSDLANTRTSYARILVYTTATTMTLASLNTWDSSSGLVGGAITVFIDGDYDQTIGVPYNATSTVEVMTLTSAKLDGKPHVVEIWEPGTEYDGTIGSPILYIQDPTGQTRIYPSLSPPPNRIAWYGDSISQSAKADIPLHGAVMLLRRSTSTTGVSLLSGAGRELYDDYLLDNTMQVLATWMCMLASDQTSGNRLIVDLMGTNDYGGVAYLSNWTSVAAFQTVYATWLDAVHATDPGMQILSLGPIIRGSETGNDAASVTPFNLVQLRAAKAAACATRSWCTYVDASQDFTANGVTTPAVTLAQLQSPQYLHPGTPGHASLFAWAQAVIQYYYPGML